MAYINDGGAVSSNISSAIQKVASAGTGAARRTRRRNTAASRSVSRVARAATNSGRASQRSQRSSNPGNSSFGRSGGNGNHYGSQQSTPRYAKPRPAVGNSSGGVVAATVPPPPPKFDNAYLAGDTTYDAQASSLHRALQDYAAQYGVGLKNYNTEYTTSLDKLKTDQGVKATELNDDFASRGLVTSGVYADALQKFNQQYDQQRNDLSRAKALYEQDALTDKNNFSTQNKLELEKARQAALQRYNDKYSL